jgi:SnoaL-like domain
MNVEELTAIEEIKRVKARYFYGVDTKDWDLCASLFTSDATIDFSSQAEFAAEGASGAASVQSESWTFTGGDEFAAWVGPRLQDVVSVHNGHDPIVTLADEGTAAAIWPMSDRLETRSEVCLGFGYYHDQYRRIDDGWLMSGLVLTRLVGVREPREAARLPKDSPVRW